MPDVWPQVWIKINPQRNVLMKTGRIEKYRFLVTKKTIHVGEGNPNKKHVKPRPRSHSGNICLWNRKPKRIILPLDSCYGLETHSRVSFWKSNEYYGNNCYNNNNYKHWLKHLERMSRNLIPTCFIITKVWRFQGCSTKMWKGFYNSCHSWLWW